MINQTEETHKVAGAELVMVKGGSGKPLLILHDELGYPGWMTWNESFAHERTLLIPLQPGYGKTPKLDWVRTFRDLGGFYSQVLREMKLDPIDVIGFSAGGFIAAEMAAADPRIFSKMVRCDCACRAFLMNCCSIVEAPWTVPLCSMSSRKARAMPRMSTPPLVSKRLSSIEITASFTIGGICAGVTMTRFSWLSTPIG